MTSLNILSGGAAQGLVTQLEGQFYAEAGRSIHGTYGAVGMMRDKLLAGEPCDVLILTQTLIEQLRASGDVLEGSVRALGKVKTGVAVKTGEPMPQVDTPAHLKAALLAAKGVYLPDPVKATAGIHFMGILKKLNIDETVANRLRPFPNGATAMREMAASDETGLIGCTQVTEIIFASGVDLVARLPQELELVTVYTAAVCARSDQPQAAMMLIDLLTSSQVSQLRLDGGFE
jgi:molybdate transport system substrate-binding protein